MSMQEVFRKHIAKAETEGNTEGAEKLKRQLAEFNAGREAGEYEELPLGSQHEHPSIFRVKPVEGIVLPTHEQLVAAAKAELQAGFGKDFDLPEPPEELFEDLKRLESLGITGFEPYYQMPMQLTEDDPFWEGKVKPEKYFWDQIENGNFPESVAALSGGWHLGDSRTKPNYNDGKQAYEDDYMAQLVGNLREKGVIEKCKYVPDTSRFGASPREIENVILPEFVNQAGLKGAVRSRRYMEFNIRGNTAHPELGRTTTWEWFADPAFPGDRRLVVGGSHFGGLAAVRDDSVDYRDSATGFSPVVEYPSKAA